jgi:hypothetical protein
MACTLGTSPLLFSIIPQPRGQVTINKEKAILSDVRKAHSQKDLNQESSAAVKNVKGFLFFFLAPSTDVVKSSTIVEGIVQ